MFKVRGESHELQNRKAIEKIMKPKADFSRSIKLIKLYLDIATDKERRRELSVSRMRESAAHIPQTPTGSRGNAAHSCSNST